MSTGLTIGLIGVLIVLIILSAIFSAAETAYSSVSRAKIEAAIKEGKKSALLIRKHYHKFGWTLSTILISNNIVNIGASSLVTFLFTGLMGASGTTTIISTAVMTPILVIFGEIAPKLLAKRYAFGYLKVVVYLIHALNFLFFPITYPISKITLSSKVTNTENDIIHLINIASKEGVLEVQEATLAKKALALDSTDVSSEMTKNKDIIWIDVNSTINEARKKFKETGHSRLPVKKDKEYVGILILKDLLLHKNDTKISELIKPIFYVSKNILLSKALEQLRFNKSHMALVTESSKSTKVIGLITLEDIVESLIGEIYDEHDKTQSINSIAHYKWTVVGTTPMSLVLRETKMVIPQDELKEVMDQSVKEWLQSRLKRRIRKNIKYEYNKKYEFKVISNNKNSETIIQIKRK